jgi:protein translocase, SecG subunit
MLFFKAVWIVSAVSLILLILLHSPKGDGLGGFGGQGQMFASTRSAETALNRITWILVLLFLGFTVLLSGGWLDRLFNSPSIPAPSPAVEVAPPTVNTVPETLPAESSTTSETTPVSPPQ